MADHRSATDKHPRHHKPRPVPAWKRLHRDWKTWVVVALMLAAMCMYVLSDDESLQPGGGPPTQPMPAAAGS